MHLDQMTDDRQSQAHATMLTAGFLIRLPESIENMRQKVTCDPLARIADDDLEM
jgi:hypothetical protein